MGYTATRVKIAILTRTLTSSRAALVIHTAPVSARDVPDQRRFRLSHCHTPSMCIPAICIISAVATAHGVEVAAEHR